MSNLPKAEPLPYADAEANRHRPPLDSAAKGSVIAGALFWLTPVPALVAIVLGIVGIDRGMQTGVRGKWHAWLGLLLGIGGVVFWIVAITYVYGILSNPQPPKIYVGLHGLHSVMNDYVEQNQGRYPDNLESLLAFHKTDWNLGMATCETLGDRPPTGDTFGERLASFQTGEHTSYIYLGMGLDTKIATGRTPIAFVPYSYYGYDKVSILFGDGHVEHHDRQPGMQIIQRRIDEIAKVSATTQPK